MSFPQDDITGHQSGLGNGTGNSGDAGQSTSSPESNRRRGSKVTYYIILEGV